MKIEGFQVWIPTRGRTRQQVTLRSLPKAILSQTVVVCPREEVAHYRQNWEAKGVTVIAQDPKLTNIAEKRAWMMRKAQIERLLMIDDDCWFFARCAPENRKWTESNGSKLWVPNTGFMLLSKTYATDARLMKTFAELNKLLRTRPHGGLASRNGNHVVPGELSYTTRAMHAIAFDVALFNKHVSTKNRVQCREDFDYTLQLLRKGYDNVVVAHTTVSPGSYAAPGGCFDERTLEKSNADAYRLAELHPGLVRTVQKTYKNHPRVEVAVSWKKAYKQGLENKR